MNKIPILICIDVEPDDREIDPDVRHDWKGFEKSYEFFTQLRPRLKAVTGSPVHFSWFLRMDPQIEHTYGSPTYVVTRYRDLLQKLSMMGDELGLHTHAWRWDEMSGTWSADVGNQEWINYCVNLSFESFRVAFNEPCLSFRFGDRWMNNATIELLERLGARVDLTLEPGQRVVSIGDLKERFTASLPDYAGVPRRPYRPSVHDFRKTSLWRKRALWMIPVSTGSIEWSAGVDWRLTSRPWMLMRTLKRRALDRSTGSIMTKPNPVRANYQSELAVTTVIWTSENTKAVEVHVGSPDGPSFTRGDCSGSATTGKWVTDGMRFYLQDVSDGLDLNSAHTLATTTVNVVSERPTGNFRTRAARWLGIPQNSVMTLNLGLNSVEFCRIMDTLLNVRSPYLVIVARSDAAVDPAQSSNLEHSLSHILSHPLIERFVFETPKEAIRRWH